MNANKIPVVKNAYDIFLRVIYLQIIIIFAEQKYKLTGYTINKQHLS